MNDELRGLRNEQRQYRRAWLVVISALVSIVGLVAYVALAILAK